MSTLILRTGAGSFEKSVAMRGLTVTLSGRTIDIDETSIFPSTFPVSSSLGSRPGACLRRQISSLFQRFSSIPNDTYTTTDTNFIKVSIHAFDRGHQFTVWHHDLSTNLLHNNSPGIITAWKT